MQLQITQFLVLQGDSKKQVIAKNREGARPLCAPLNPPLLLHRCISSRLYTFLKHFSGFKDIPRTAED